MAKLQVTLSDDLTDALDGLRKFDKSSFTEMALREALKNPEILNRFIWKNKPAGVKIEDVKTDEVNKNFKLDKDFN